MEKRPPGYPVLASLLGLSVLVHLFDALLTRANPSPESVSLLSLLSLDPSRVLGRWEWWRPFTSILVHRDAGHLLVNGIALFLLGRDLEERWGSFRFAAFALAGLPAAAAAAFALAPAEPSGGTTGLVLAVFLAHAIRYGDRRVAGNFRVRHVILLGFLAVLASGAKPDGIRTSDWAVPIGSLAGSAASLALAPAAAAWDARRHRRAAILRRRRMRQVRQRTDWLLEKIRTGGMDALTPREREFLAEASRLYREATKPVEAREAAPQETLTREGD